MDGRTDNTAKKIAILLLVSQYTHTLQFISIVSLGKTKDNEAGEILTKAYQGTSNN
jgi:hypothetical protein